MPRVPTTRDDTPAYLARYEARQGRGRGHAGGDRARVRRSSPGTGDATGRARTHAQPDAPPGRTAAFARETVAPRELQWPESLRPTIATRDRRAPDPPRPDPGLHLRQRAHRARSVAGASEGAGPGEGDAGRLNGADRARRHGSGSRDRGRARRRAPPGGRSLRHPRRHDRGPVSGRRASATSRRGSTAASSTSRPRSRSSPTCSRDTSATVAAIGPGGWSRWIASTASSSQAATRSRAGSRTRRTTSSRPPTWCAGTGRRSSTRSSACPRAAGCSCAATLRRFVPWRRQRSATTRASPTTWRTSASGSTPTESTRR